MAVSQTKDLKVQRSALYSGCLLMVHYSLDHGLIPCPFSILIYKQKDVSYAESWDVWQGRCRLQNDVAVFQTMDQRVRRNALCNRCLQRSTIV